METVGRALHLLKQLGERPLNGIECAEVMGIHKSSASRMLAVMRKEGFVALNSQKKYEIGPAIYQLANALSENMRIRNAAYPDLLKLGEKTGETIHLSVLDGENVLYIEKIDSNKMIRLHSTIGAANPVYCTGVGKALLAFQPKKTIEKLLAKMKYISYTANTITDSQALQEELVVVREEGVAYDFEEHYESVNCIAAPVFNDMGRAVASISISSTTIYTDRESLLRYKGGLLGTAREVSKKLGYKGTIPPKNS